LGANGEKIQRGQEAKVFFVIFVFCHGRLGLCSWLWDLKIRQGERRSVGRSGLDWWPRVVSLTREPVNPKLLL